MINAAKIISLSCSFISLVSNGYLLTKDIAKELINSGITRVQISLDGAKKETHERLRGKEGSFERAINAIKILKEIDFKDVGVAFCPTSFNYYELEETVKICKNLGVNNFRVQPLMVLGRAKYNLQKILPTPQQYRELVKKIEKLKQIYFPEMIIEWGDPVDHLICFSTFLEHCIAFVGIKANGAIETSPYLPIVVGNIRRHKLSEYWNKGLVKLWEIKKIKDMARKIVSIKDMGIKKESIPIVWHEKDIELDLIDDKPFNQQEEE